MSRQRNLVRLVQEMRETDEGEGGGDSGENRNGLGHRKHGGASLSQEGISDITSSVFP